MSDDLPSPDQAPGAPHPRETAELFGQDAAQAAFGDLDLTAVFGAAGQLGDAADQARAFAAAVRRL